MKIKLFLQNIGLCFLASSSTDGYLPTSYLKTSQRCDSFHSDGHVGNSAPWMGKDSFRLLTVCVATLAEHALGIRKYRGGRALKYQKRSSSHWFLVNFRFNWMLVDDATQRISFRKRVAMYVTLHDIRRIFFAIFADHQKPRTRTGVECLLSSGK